VVWECVRRRSSAYAGAIACGRAENPPDRHGELSRAGKLVERFAQHGQMILRFVLDLAVPFTNNTAERALRSVKLQQKISATWRILQGLADFAVVRSYSTPPRSTASTHSMYCINCSPPDPGCHPMVRRSLVPHCWVVLNRP
jgi:transposase